QTAVISLRPYGITGIHRHKLDDDPDLVSRFANTALENGFDFQLLSNFADIHIFASKTKRRSPRRDLQTFECAQRRDEFFGKAVTKIFLIAVRAEIHKRKNSKSALRGGIGGNR